MRYPLDSMYITSPFGWRIHPIYKDRRHHDGVDLRATVGTKAYAIADGIINAVKNFGGYGLQLFVLHNDGALSHYAHLSKVFVSVGQKVTGGQILAHTGNSGTLTTAPHLHFGVQEKSKWIDPMMYLERLKEMEKKYFTEIEVEVNGVVLKGHIPRDEGRAYVQVRDLAERFAGKLDWDAAKNRAKLEIFSDNELKAKLHSLQTEHNLLIKDIESLVKKYKREE